MKIYLFLSRSESKQYRTVVKPNNLNELSIKVRFGRWPQICNRKLHDSLYLLQCYARKSAKMNMLKSILIFLLWIRISNLINSSSLRIESENTKSYRTYPTRIRIESENSKCIRNNRITLRIECVKTGRPVSSTSWIFNWLLRKSLQSQWMLWIKLWTCPHSDNLFFYF